MVHTVKQATVRIFIYRSLSFSYLIWRFLYSKWFSYLAQESVRPEGEKNGSTPIQGARSPWRIIFFAAASNDCRYSVWYLFRVTIFAPRILRVSWVLGKFVRPWKCVPLYLLVFLLCVDEFAVSNLPRENSCHDFARFNLSDASLMFRFLSKTACFHWHFSIFSELAADGFTTATTSCDSLFDANPSEALTRGRAVDQQ
jgi:hypothetical protein